MGSDCIRRMTTFSITVIAYNNTFSRFIILCSCHSITPCIDNTAFLIRLFTSMRIHLQVATSYTLVLQQTRDILVAIRVLQQTQDFLY